MSGRETILGKVRAGLGTGRADGSRRAALEQRLAENRRHLTLRRVAGKGPGELARLFRGFLEGQAASVLEVSSAQDVPAAVARYLRQNNLPARLRVGGDARLARLPWHSEPHLEVLLGRAHASDEVGLGHALAGVAESGTLVMASGADNPVTLGFMPETHIVVISERDILPAYEDAWSRVRERYGAGAMPRTVNFISGPSRTGDIGGQLVMGAHGPRRLCVIVVKERDGA